MAQGTIPVVFRVLQPYDSTFDHLFGNTVLSSLGRTRTIDEDLQQCHRQLALPVTDHGNYDECTTMMDTCYYDECIAIQNELKKLKGRMTAFQNKRVC